MKHKLIIILMLVIIFAVNEGKTVSIITSNSLMYQADTIEEAKGEVKTSDYTESYSVNIGDFTAKFVEDTSYVLDVNGETMYGQGYYMVYNDNNQIVYCIDPTSTAWKVTNENNIQSYEGTKYEEFTKEQKREIREIVAATNERYEETKSLDTLVAGQILVWQATGAEIVEVSETVSEEMEEIEVKESEEELVYYDTIGQDLVGSEDVVEDETTETDGGEEEKEERKLKTNVGFKTNASEDIETTAVRLNIEVSETIVQKMKRIVAREESKINEIQTVKVGLKAEEEEEIEYELSKQEVETLKREKEVEVKIEGLTAKTEYEIEVRMYDEEGKEIEKENSERAVKEIVTDYEGITGEIEMESEEEYEGLEGRVVRVNNPDGLEIKEERVYAIDEEQEIEGKIEEGKIEIEGLEAGKEYEIEVVAEYSKDNERYEGMEEREVVASEEARTKEPKQKPKAKISEETNYDLKTKELTLKYEIEDEEETLLEEEARVEIEVEGKKVKEEVQSIDGSEKEVKVSEEELGEINGKEIEVQIYAKYDLVENGKADGEELIEEGYEIEVPEIIEKDDEEYVTIETCEGLVNIDNGVGGGIGYSDDYNYMLTEDIDCEGEVESNYIEENEGIIDGDNHTISNVVIKQGESNNVGLVGVNNGEIRNLKVENPDVEGYDNVGVIAGVNNGEIEGVEVSFEEEEQKELLASNCSEEEKQCVVRGNSYTGGIVGVNNGLITSATIVAENVKGDQIEGLDRGTGGIAGYNNQGIINDCVVSGVNISANHNTAAVVGKNNGSVEGSQVSGVVIETTGDDNGGVVGANQERGTVDNSSVENVQVYGSTETGIIAGVNHGKITDNNVNNSGVHVGTSEKYGASNGYTGGIVGENYAGAVEGNTISNSIVESTNDKGTGGIAGLNNGGLTMSDNHVVNTTVTGGSNTGGVVGYNRGTISTSDVTGAGTIQGADNVGGIAGYNVGTVTNSEVIMEEKEEKYSVEGKNNIGGIVDCL